MIFGKQNLKTSESSDEEIMIGLIQKAIEKHNVEDKARLLLQESRLQDLELWRAKLHAMITEKTPRGQEKLNKIGRRFIRP